MRCVCPNECDHKISAQIVALIWRQIIRMIGMILQDVRRQREYGELDCGI